MQIGTLKGARRYPVKSLRGEPLDFAQVDATGVRGDRTSALFVRSGNPRVGKTYRGKEDERLHLLDDTHAAREGAAARGVELEIRLGGRFFDDAPISLLVDRWLDDLSRYLGYRVEWERFRPNFFVSADNGFAGTENDLVDAELRLGAVKLRVRSPIQRCVTPTYHLKGEAGDPRILRFIAQERNACMGIYCDVLEPGIVRTGEMLTRE